MSFDFIKKINFRKFYNPYVLVFLINSVFIFLIISYFQFIRSGHVVYVDVTEGIRLEDTFNKYFYTFDDNWGDSLVEKERIPLMLPLIFLYKILPLSVGDFVPLKFLYFYLLSLISFLLSIKILLSALKVKPAFLPIFAAAFFYLYNPWMTNRLMHFFLFGSSVTVPLVFAYTYRYFFVTKTTKDLVYISIFLGLLLGTPHTALLVSLSVLPIIFYKIYRKEYRLVLKYILIILLVTIGLSMYWFLPYILFRPIPDRLESLTIIELLARNTGFFRNLMLQGYWWEYIPNYVPDVLKKYTLILNIFYLLPFFYFCLYVYTKRKNAFTTILFTLFILSLFLSTNNIVTIKFYDLFLYNVFIKGKLDWLFREIEKISFLLAFSYSLCLLLLFGFKKYSKYLILFILVTFGLYAFYLFAYFDTNLEKVEVPSDYYVLNDILNSDSSREYNVTFYPQVQQVSWANRIDSSNYFSNLSSLMPVIPLSEGDSRSKYYINYILNSFNISGLDIAGILNQFGTKYLVIRNDHKYVDYSRTIELLKEKVDLRVAYEGETLTVFENLKFTGLIDIKSNLVYSNMGLKTLEFLSLLDTDFSTTSIFYSDLNSNETIKYNAYLLDENGPIDYVIGEKSSQFSMPSSTLKISDPTKGWALGSLTDLTHAESSFYFRNAKIESYQFNYDFPIALSLEGINLKKVSFSQLFNDRLSFTFPQNGNYSSINNNNDLTIQYIGSNSLEPWNVYRSNRFDVQNIESLYSYANVQIPVSIEPHFKIKYFDNLGNVLGEHVFYSTEEVLEANSKVLKGAVSAEFSIWTKGDAEKINSWQISNLFISNSSGKTEPYNFSFNVKNSCSNDCYLYLRILKSPASKKIGVKINGSSELILDTYSAVTKFVWVPVYFIGSGSVDVRIFNLEGINAVASSVVLDKTTIDTKVSDFNNYLQTAVETVRFNSDMVLYLFDKSLPSTQTITVFKKNSTFYEVISSGVTSSIISFKKPYSNMWYLNSQNQSFKESGFFNGFYINESYVYTIAHRPQFYFYVGIFITLFTFVTIITYLYRSSKHTK